MIAAWILTSMFGSQLMVSWPRRVFGGKDYGVLIDELPEWKRTEARVFQPAAFFLGAFFVMLGSAVIWNVEPEHSQRVMVGGFWVLFGGIGAAMGVLEISSGLVSDRLPTDGGGSKLRRFRFDPELANKVGAWRLISCIGVNILMQYLGFHLFPEI